MGMARVTKDGKLEIGGTPNQDGPLMEGKVPSSVWTYGSTHTT